MEKDCHSFSVLTYNQFQWLLMRLCGTAKPNGMAERSIGSSTKPVNLAHLCLL